VLIGRKRPARRADRPAAGEEPVPFEPAPASRRSEHHSRPDTYDRSRSDPLHGVRIGSELAYASHLRKLPKHDYLGEQVREKLVYYPTVTREAFHNQAG